MKSELLISLRYLKSRQNEKFISLITFISMAGVAVGVAALIVVLAVMSGFDNELKEKIIGMNSHITVQKEGGIKDAGYFLNVITEMPHVTGAEPFVSGQAILRHNDNITGVLLKGIDSKKREGMTNLASYLKKGGLDLSGDKIIIGSEYADTFRLGIGDRINIISPQSGASFTFEVGGIFSSGMYDYDLNLVFVSLENGQKVFGSGDSVSGISVRVDDEFRASSVKKEIQEKLGYTFWVRSWIDLNRNLFAALKLEKTAMFIILTLIVLVACFNIASTLIMIVLKKAKDIGILRAIGATKKSIMTIFALDGLFIGLVGTVFGWSIGFILCRLLKEYQFIRLPSDIYYIDKLPVLLKPVDALLICGAAMALSFLATLYPAYSATRLEPVEAIRYE